MSIVDTAPQVPINEFDLLTWENHARQLLPNPMRTPLQMAVVSTSNLVLSGIQTVNGVTGSNDLRVIVKDNVNPAENGPYFMRSGAWQRMTDFPTQSPIVGQLQVLPTKFLLAQFLTMFCATNQTYCWVTTPDTILPGQTPITIETLGPSIFSWHFGQAEKEIVRDLDRRHQPLYFRFLQKLEQLTPAKTFKTLEILYLQSSAGSGDGVSDRNLRLSKEFGKRYEHELETTVLRLIDGGRVKGRQRRVVRG